ncbi:MAG: VCBS repeat-containing protein, partial [Pirellulaceae bacterium]|nr:VCBS repeat-containing protein [Pirellulaceae bacterium]
MRRNGVLLALGLLIGVGAALWFVRPVKKDIAGEAISPQMLTRAVQIVALAENGQDYRGAMAGWTELLTARPNDRDLLLNQAVTVLKWISDTNSTLSSGSVTDATKLEALQSQLQDAYAEADRVLARLVATQVSGDEATGKQVLLESVLLETRSRDQSDEQSLALRQQATEKILAALKQRPDQLWLVGRLIDLAEELQLDWPEVTPRATEAIYQAWKSTPRNMLLLVRAGEGLLEQKDARLLEVLTASLELSQPLLPMLPDAARIQPAELIKTVGQQVSAGDWSRAARVRAWLNILRSSSAFQSDRRLVNPDFMALLNTSFLEKWRVAVSQTNAAPATALPPVVVTSIVSSVERIPDSAQSEPTLPDAEPVASRLAWYDYDVDRDFEIVALQGNQLRLIDPKSPATALSKLTLPFEPTGLVIVDLWSVDNPQRPRIDRTLPTSPATPTVPDAAPADNSLSHDTIQEIVVWDRSQIIVVSPKPNSDPNVSTDPNSWIIHDQVPGLASLTRVRQVLPLELESDGDLDLVISTDSGLRLLQNNGNRTFEDVTAFSSLPPAGWLPTSLVACDYDRDLDIDLVCSSVTAPYLAVLENILHSQLRFREFDQGEQPIDAAAANLAVAELDGNASWDWCVLTEKSVESLLTRTTAPGQLNVTRRVSLKLPEANLPEAKPTEAKPTETLKVCDLNLDGWLDLCVAGAGGLNAYLGDGQRFSATSYALISQAVVGLDVQDIDGDGRLELLTRVDGEVWVVKVSPASPGHYLSARVRGISDNKGGNNNHYGYGGVVELWAGGRYQARVIDSPQVHFGLPAQKADDLRVIFTNGLTQNVMD